MNSVGIFFIIWQLIFSSKGGIDWTFDEEGSKGRVAFLEKILIVPSLFSCFVLRLMKMFLRHLVFLILSFVFFGGRHYLVLLR